MTKLNPNLPVHNIGVVERRTGMKADLIRAWERRYGAVVPQRTETDRRLYSEADLQRLRLLHQATKLGHRISHIASLGDEQLYSLLEPATREHHSSAISDPDVGSRSQRCFDAIDRLDSAALHEELVRASFTMSRFALVEELLVPLMEEVGRRWLQGNIDPAHEHLATAVVKRFIGGFLSDLNSTDRPTIVVTTPSGQLHELGALMASAMATAEGWQVLYLGPDLPSASIAKAALRSRSLAVALSITYPKASPNLVDDLETLADALAQASSPAISLIFGGRGASGLDSFDDRRAVFCVGNLGEFQQTLSRVSSLRSRVPS